MAIDDTVGEHGQEDRAYPETDRHDGTRWLLIGILVVSVLSAVAGTYFGLRGGNPRSQPGVAVPRATTATTAPPRAPSGGATTSGAATRGPTNRVAPAGHGTTPTPRRPKRRALADTPTSVAVPGGSFVVRHGLVSLTHVVVRGDTLFAIARWYELQGGYAALYDWNHSTVGRNPNLIFPGEVLTITVPAGEIPTISPVWLAEAGGRR